MTTETTTTETTTTEAPKKTEKAGRQMSFHVLDTGVIRADFEGLDPLILDPSQVPEALHVAAMLEGFTSRLRGATSRLVDAERTPENLRSAVEKGMASLIAGVWKIERAAGEAEYSIEVEAAFRFRKMRAQSKGEEFTGTLEEAAANFAALSEDQKKALKALPRYQLAMAEVKAERQAAKAAKMAKKVESDEADVGF